MGHMAECVGTEDRRRESGNLEGAVPVCTCVRARARVHVCAHILKKSQAQVMIL